MKIGKLNCHRCPGFHLKSTTGWHCLYPESTVHTIAIKAKLMRSLFYSYSLLMLLAFYDSLVWTYPALSWSPCRPFIVTQAFFVFFFFFQGHILVNNTWCKEKQKNKYEYELRFFFIFRHMQICTFLGVLHSPNMFKINFILGFDLSSQYAK